MFQAKLAITGGIAEGKSTVLGYVRSLGVEAASVDDFAAEVFKDPAVQQRIASLLRRVSPVSAREVREAISREPQIRRGLNNITHPLILQAMKASKAPVLEVPLLIETCLHPYFRRIWVVTCGPAEQLRRLSERLDNEREARRIIALQLPTQIKCAFADRVVRTNAEQTTVQAYVTEAFSRDLA